MKKQTLKTEKKENIKEKTNINVLISGTGNINIEKDDKDSFKIVGERLLNIPSEEMDFKLEKEARSKANKFIYTQLANKLEKSIRTENLILLTGAGSSIECGGPSMPGLWKITSKDSNITQNWEDLLNASGYKPKKGKENLEELLSNLQAITHAYEINKEGKDFSEIIKKIENKILEECEKVKIDEKSSHVRFLMRILRGRSISTPRLKVFTLNYDTAFEQASTKIEAVLIDGFSFSSEKTFKSTEFDLDIVQRERSRIHNEENFYKKVFQLYKIHGSVNWRFDSIKKEITKDNGKGNRVLIYPNSSKFERSFEMPFFEMISRLQAVLRSENTTLLIVGYSFGDEHINRIIEESINNNLNLEVFIIKPTLSGEKIDEYIERVNKGSKNIHLISSTFEQFANGMPDAKIGQTHLEEDNEMI